MVLMACLGTSAFAQTGTVSNHSLHATLSFLPSLGYSYEQRLGNNFTILLSGGLTGAFGEAEGWFDSGPRLFGPNLYIAVEPRLYYNLARRTRLERNTNLNSADFFSLKLHQIMWPLLKSDIMLDGQMIVSPVWGLRRVFGHFLLEATAGLDINLYNSTTGLHLGVKLGYNF